MGAPAFFPGGFVQVPAGADAHLEYFWSYVGGQPGDVVSVEIDYVLQVHAFGTLDAEAFASVISKTSLTPFAQACADTKGLCGADSTQGSFGSLHVLVRPGEIDTLELQATAGGVFFLDANGSSALADPHIHLDPAFPGEGYTLVLSAGIGNELPVPEPASALLMAAGLAGLGLLRRRPA